MVVKTAITGANIPISCLCLSFKTFSDADTIPYFNSFIYKKFAPYLLPGRESYFYNKMVIYLSMYHSA